MAASPSASAVEAARVAALDRYAILDSEPEEAFDDLVGPPIDHCSVLAPRRAKAFKACHGTHSIFGGRYIVHFKK